jgi:CRP-like cAMP-binding protein
MKFKFIFKEKKELLEAHGLLKQMWATKQPVLIRRESSANSTGPTISRVASGDSASKVFKVLPPEDWDLILKGAKCISVRKDEVIIAQGEHYQRIYQISRGVCRTEVKILHFINFYIFVQIQQEGKRVVLGKMGQGETFGEISFLRQGKGASASVLADSEDGVDLTIIEGYFVNALFNVNPAFAGRFFKYLATLLAYRIRAREAQSK